MVDKNIADYKYRNGRFVYEPKVIIPTSQEINKKTVEKIRTKYDINEEIKMLRLGILDNSNTEFLAYNAYVEECWQLGEAEKQKYGLNIKGV